MLFKWKTGVSHGLIVFYWWQILYQKVTNFFRCLSAPLSAVNNNKPPCDNGHYANIYLNKGFYYHAKLWIILGTYKATQHYAIWMWSHCGGLHRKHSYWSPGTFIVIEGWALSFFIPHQKKQDTINSKEYYRNVCFVVVVTCYIFSVPCGLYLICGHIR